MQSAKGPKKAVGPRHARAELEHHGEDSHLRWLSGREGPVLKPEIDRLRSLEPEAYAAFGGMRRREACEGPGPERGRPSPQATRRVLEDRMEQKNGATFWRRGGKSE